MPGYEGPFFLGRQENDRGLSFGRRRTLAPATRADQITFTREFISEPPMEESESEKRRNGPVIVITGTPGTGKSTTASMLVEASPIPLTHINVGDLVKQHSLHDGFDEEWQSYLVDDDKVKI